MLCAELEYPSCQLSPATILCSATSCHPPPFLAPLRGDSFPNVEGAISAQKQLWELSAQKAAPGTALACEPNHCTRLFLQP